MEADCRGTWNVSSTVNSEPPNGSVAAPPLTGSFMSSMYPVTGPLSTLFAPFCGRCGGVRHVSVR